MKLTLEYIEVPNGNVEFSMRGNPGPYTAREKDYMDATIALMREHVPIIGKQLGAKTAIFSNPAAKPKNQ